MRSVVARGLSSERLPALGELSPTSSFLHDDEDEEGEEEEGGGGGGGRNGGRGDIIAETGIPADVG